MRNIREFAASDVDGTLEVLSGAYPNFYPKDKEAREKIRAEILASLERRAELRRIVVEENGAIIGAARYHNYEMTWNGRPLPVGGLGGVATHFMAKKRGIAKEIVTDFLLDCKRRGVFVAALYPFRIDFYQNMGFGLSVFSHLYRIKPEEFPVGSMRERCRQLHPADSVALLDLFNRFAKRQHGMFLRTPHEVREMVEKSDSKVVVVQRPGGDFGGYMVFRFANANVTNMLSHDLEVNEIFWERPEDLSALCGFLAVQADQVRFVDIITFEPDLHVLLRNPAHEPSVGVRSAGYLVSKRIGSVMHRVIDCRGFLNQIEGHSFGPGKIALRFVVRDALLPENAGPYTLAFDNGKMSLGAGPGDLEIGIDIADFSRLFMGAVTLSALYRCGCVTLSNPGKVYEIDRLLGFFAKPVCVTGF